MSATRIITALLLPLATARLTTLITEDQITAPAREKAFAWLDTLPDTHPAHRLQLGYLLTCNRCISIYAAAALAAASKIPPLRPLIPVLALSQLALTALDATDRILAPHHASAQGSFDFDATPTTQPAEPRG